MPFTSAFITDFQIHEDGADLLLSWAVEGSLTAGSGGAGLGAVATAGEEWFHVYVDHVLTWIGQGLSCVIPAPLDRAKIQVGETLANEQGVDWSGTGAGYGPCGGGTAGGYTSWLDAAIRDRARLSWLGGPSLGTDLAGFRVYQSAIAGGAVDYNTVMADIPARFLDYAGGGAGEGPCGSGGAGQSVLRYSWTSDPLGGGTWNFAVRAYDTAGNEQTVGATTSLAITAPPLPPAADADNANRRAWYTASPFTLRWNASPSA